MPKMNEKELQEFLENEFVQCPILVEKVEPMGATIRQPITDAYLRPGGTVSGPALMLAADAALYIAILAEIGPVALAVTTNFNINFLRKPAPNDIIAEAKIHKLGGRLAVGEITLFSEGNPDPVAHATATYSIPPAQ